MIFIQRVVRLPRKQWSQQRLISRSKSLVFLFLKKRMPWAIWHMSRCISIIGCSAIWFRKVKHRRNFSLLEIRKWFCLRSLVWVWLHFSFSFSREHPWNRRRWERLPAGMDWHSYIIKQEQNNVLKSGCIVTEVRPVLFLWWWISIILSRLMILMVMQ